MQKTFVLAIASILALSAPALAQSAGSPGAVGAGGGSGSNPPGSGVDSMKNTGSGGAMKGEGAMKGNMSEGRAAAPNNGTMTNGTNNGN